MKKRLQWPTAAVLIAALIVIGATLLAGPALGLSPETLHSALASEGLLSAVVLGAMRQLLGTGAGGGES